MDERLDYAMNVMSFLADAAIAAVARANAVGSARTLGAKELGDRETRTLAGIILVLHSEADGILQDLERTHGDSVFKAIERDYKAQAQDALAYDKLMRHIAGAVARLGDQGLRSAVAEAEAAMNAGEHMDLVRRHRDAGIDAANELARELNDARSPGEGPNPCDKCGRSTPSNRHLPFARTFVVGGTGFWASLLAVPASVRAEGDAKRRANALLDLVEQQGWWLASVLGTHRGQQICERIDSDGVLLCSECFPGVAAHPLFRV